jgi:hypothetical protein
MSAVSLQPQAPPAYVPGIVMKSIFHRLLRSDPTTDTNDNNDGDEGGGDGIGRRLQARDLWWLQNKDENRSRNEDKISEGDNNDGTANVDASIGANNVSSNNNNRSMMSRMFADVSPDNEDNTHNNLPGYADNESCRSEDYSDMIDVLSSVDTNTHSPQRRHDGHSDHAHTDRGSGSGSGTHRDKQLSLQAFTQTLSDIQHDLLHPASPTTTPTTTANTRRRRNGDEDEEQEELYEQTLSPPSSTGSVSSPSPQKFILRPTQQTHAHIQPAHTQTTTDPDTDTPTPTPTPPRAHIHRSSPSKIPLPALAAALFADDEPVSAHTSGRPTHTRARMYSSPSARPSRIPRHLSAYTPTTPTTGTHKQTPKQTRTPTDTHISPSKRHAHLVAPSPPRETIVPRNAYAHTQNDYVYYVTATLDYEQTHPHMKANPYAYTHNHDNSYVLDPDEQLSTHSSTRSPSQRASTHRHTHSPTHSLTHSPTQRTQSRQQTHHDTNYNNDYDDAQAISTTASTRDIVTAAVSKHSYANKQTEHAALLRSLGVSTQPPYVSESAHTQPAHIQHAYVHLDNNDDSDTITTSSKFSKLDRQLSIYKKKFADLAASKQSKQQSPVRKHPSPNSNPHTSTHHRDRTIDDIFNSGLHTNTNSSNKHSPMSALSAFKHTNTHTASPPPPPPPAHCPPQTHRHVHTNTHTHDDDDGDDMSDMTASRVHSHAHTDIDPADSVTDDVLTRKMLALLRKANKLTQSYDVPAVDTADTRGSGDTHTGNTRSADTHTNTGTHTDRRMGATGHRQMQVDNDVGNVEVDGDEDDDVLARARRLIAAVNGNTQHTQHTQQQTHTQPADTNTRTDDHSMNALRVSQGTEDVINVLNTPPSRTRSPTESPSVHSRTTQAQDASQSPPKETSNPSNTGSHATESSVTPGEDNDDDDDGDEYDFSDSSYFIKPSSKPEQQQSNSVDNTNANVNANLSTSSLTSLFPSLEPTHKTASAPSSSRVHDVDDDDAYIARTEASAGAGVAAGPSKQGQYQQYMQRQQRHQQSGSAAFSDAKYDSEEDEKAADITRPRADSPILPGRTRFDDANGEEDDDDDDNDSLRRAHTLLSKYSQRYSQSQSHGPSRRDESSPVKDSSVLYLSSSGELDSKYNKPLAPASPTPAHADVDTQTQTSTSAMNNEESSVSRQASSAAERSVSSRPVVSTEEMYASLPLLAADKTIAITTAVTYTPRITPDRDCMQSIISRLQDNGSGATVAVDNVIKDPTLRGLLKRLEDVRGKMTDLSRASHQESVRE